MQSSTQLLSVSLGCDTDSFIFSQRDLSILWCE